MHLEPHDTSSSERLIVFMVLDHNTNVIVEEVHLLTTLEGRRGDESYRKATRNVIIPLQHRHRRMKIKVGNNFQLYSLIISHGSRKVVYNPVNSIFIINNASKQAHVSLKRCENEKNTWFLM